MFKKYAWHRDFEDKKLYTVNDKTVFLCIPHYVFTSDLLRTRYIEYLSLKYRVVVFTPMLGPAETRQGNYPHSPNIEYVKWPLEHPRLLSRFKLFRVALIREFDYLSAVQHFYRRPTFQKNWKRRALRFLGWPLGWLFTADFFTGLERLLLRPSPRFSEYVRRYRPTLLITATPGFNPIEAELIHQAHKVRLRTVAVNFTWDNLTTNCNHIRKTDFLIVWNEVVKKEAIDIHHYRPEKIFISGTVKFDPYFSNISELAPISGKHPVLRSPDLSRGGKTPGVERGKELSREEFLISKGLDPKKATLVFCSKPKVYREQLEHVRAIIHARDRGELVKPVNLLIRPHPLDEPAFYNEFLGLPDVWIDRSGKVMPFGAESVSSRTEMDEEDFLNLKYTLKYGDVHLQYGSTLAIEAAIFDKPIINIGFLKTLRHDESFITTHYLPVLESGAAPITRSVEELIEWINRYLRDPSLDREKRAKLVEYYIKASFRDGRAYERNVDFLERILNG